MPLLTEKHPFITDDGTEIELDMMNRAGYYPCAEILELNSTALSIPYKVCILIGHFIITGFFHVCKSVHLLTGWEIQSHNYFT